jgi:hypothetical protein
LEGFVKYAVDIGSVAMMNIQSFIKTGSGIRKLLGGYTEAQREWRSYKPTLGSRLRKACAATIFLFRI